ncbi:MAG: hypothetical protein A2V65_07905, partial [Deltaproteobacteria bacterium RBG_13_49_15]
MWSGLRVKRNKEKKIMGRKRRFIAAAVILAAIIMAGYFGFKFHLEKIARQKVEDFISKTSGLMEIDYRKVSVNLIGLNAQVKDVTVKPQGEKEGIKIDKITLYKAREGKDKSHGVHIALNGISVHADQLIEDRDTVRDLGYQNIKADMEVDYDYDDRKREFRLNTLRIGAKEIGDIDFSLQLTNIELDPEKVILMLFSFPRIEINEAVLNFTDDSLVRRLLNFYAKKEGKTVDEAIRQLTVKMDEEITRANDPFVTQSMEAVKSFIY